MSAGGVQVWRTARGAWRWRYLEPPAGQVDAGHLAELLSAHSFDTAEAAVSAARTAYPGVPVDVAPAPGPVPWTRRWASRAVLGVVGVLATRRGGRGSRRRVSP